ncbi:MAG: sensor histidine kinase [Pseudorhodoplanes sp.]|uniref:sensor histidine kinase n=1 Tax=Pseudorhodoplanes sp. TaxID=1934341 RepID=UPI003D0A63B3
MPGDWLRSLTDRTLAPGSAGAFLFAALCIAIATVTRYLLGLLDPHLVLFAAHFPAVMVVALWAGAQAAIFATLLSIVTVIPLFGPSGPVTRLEVLNSVFFALSCLLMIVVAYAYRGLVARYRAQEKQKNLMVRELEHRGKNTFSVVESIVLQTLAHDPETAKVITGRIRAVSSTNDIISHAANLQPDLHTLIQAKFEPFGDFRATLRGGEVILPADGARNLSLVFHELVTNAIKHGALSRPEGRIDISWAVEDATLRIDWVERGGPPASPPEQRGFGTRLVVGCMKSLGGRVDAAFPPEGLECRLQIPHGRTPAG